MVDRVHLSPAERELVTLARDALQVPTDQWVVARFALARSLQMPEPPAAKDFPPLAQQEQGVALHPRQLVGEGREDGEDHSDAFRALLSIYEGRDLFADDVAFHEALQRHVRRGLKVMDAEWRETGSLPGYLAQQVLYDSGDAGVAAGGPIDPELPGRIMRVLGELGVGAALVAQLDGPRLTRLTLELRDYDDLERLRRSLEKLSFALGLGREAFTIELADAERQVHLFVPRAPALWRVVSWSEVADELRSDRAAEMALPICLGTDVLGHPLLLDLAVAPHLLVGGTTGSGKSMCLHAMLLSLLEGPVGRPQLVLIDPKEVEFTAYERSARLRGGVVRDAGTALETLNGLLDEMDARQERFRLMGARDFAEAVAKGADLERIVVVVDELGDLFMQNPSIEDPLIRLAQKARSAGIHLVLATQRPEAATFSGMLRSNVPSRIALTVQKASESRIILDETGAEDLLMRGDMLVKIVGEPTRRGHGCRVDQADILAAVALS